MSQAAESLTVRGTAAGSRPFATDATSTCTASGDVLFATGHATATDDSSTVTVIAVSIAAMAAVATDKQTAKRYAYKQIVVVFAVVICNMIL